MKDPRHHLAKVAYGTLLERRPENEEIAQVCRKLARSVFEALEDGCLPLVLGGTILWRPAASPEAPAFTEGVVRRSA